MSTLAWPTATRAAAARSRSTAPLQPMSVGSGVDAGALRAVMAFLVCGGEQSDIPAQRGRRRGLERQELDAGGARPEPLDPPLRPADPYDFVMLGVLAAHRQPTHCAFGNPHRALDQAARAAEVDELDGHFAHDAAN